MAKRLAGKRWFEAKGRRAGSMGLPQAFGRAERHFWPLWARNAYADGWTHQQRLIGRCTLDNAPIGTRAPAIMGGAWCKVGQDQWKWNGPNGSGSTFPRPGGDWNGELVAAEDYEARF